MKVATLSGWAQQADVLTCVVPDGAELEILDYSKFNDAESFFEHVKTLDLQPDILIGWSCGGQLSMRLVGRGIIKPKLLVTIAPPYKYVTSVQSSIQAFGDFVSSFTEDPQKALTRFTHMVSFNDDVARQLRSTKTLELANVPNLMFWLDELGRYSCDSIDFSAFPDTILIHGAEDIVVSLSQSYSFAEKIPHAELHVFQDSGHAVHLSHTEEVKKLITKAWQKHEAK